MRLKHFINEKRRNPDLNPRVSFEDLLEKYKGREDIFITCTKLPKFGINPNNVFDTPTGIYSYPVDYIIKEEFIPFGDDRPYRIFFQATGNIIDTKKFNTSLYEKYLEKLQDLVEKTYSKKYKITLDEFNRIVNKAKESAKYNSYIVEFWNITRRLSLAFSTLRQMSEGRNERISSKGANIWTAIMLDLGIDGFVDFGGGIIHENEPTQAVFFNTSKLKIVELYQLEFEKIALGMVRAKNFTDFFNAFKYQHKKSKRIYNPMNVAGMTLWNFEVDTNKMQQITTRDIDIWLKYLDKTISESPQMAQLKRVNEILEWFRLFEDFLFKYCRYKLSDPIVKYLEKRRIEYKNKYSVSNYNPEDTI